jgi:hypothetical protein
MNWLFIVGALLIIYGSILLCGDSAMVVNFAKRHRLGVVLKVALCDWGLERYRRYLGGAGLAFMGLILVVLAATGHRPEP